MSALGFLVNSADLGFLAIKLAKAVFDGARIVMFRAVVSVWTTSGTSAKRSNDVVSRPSTY